MITLDTISRHEFIGLNTQIVNSNNQQVIGLNGTVINETKSMFTINTEKGIKSIPKSTNDFKFTVQNKEIIVNGSKISKRPFERIGGKAWLKI